MIALIPLLAGGGDTAGGVALKFGWSIAGIVAAFAVFRLLVPRALDWIMRTRVRELFVLASLLICLGLALISAALGLSLALGAFLAGLIVADSPYAHQTAADILPFRDVFISLFFISIGLLLDLRVLSGMVWMAAAIAAGVFILKASVNFATLMILRQSRRGASIGALGLAQVGEFSFVLAGAARAQGFLSGPGFQLFLSSAILTMIATPFLLRAADAVSDRLGRAAAKRPSPRAEEGGAASGMKDHVVIAGYGLNGQNLARVLRTAGIPHLIIDLDPNFIRKAGEDCEKSLFGDVCRADILRLAGVTRAKIVVFAISDATATRRGVKLVRGLGSNAQIIVRTRYVAEIDDLYAAGADIVVPEEFETSIEIFSRVLESYHIPKNVVNAEVQVLRAERYGVLRAVGPVRPSMEKIADLLTAGTAETFYIGQNCPVSGLTLAQIDLRARTGATVIAVVRGDDSFTGPAADFVLETGDTLVLVASHAAMDNAFHYLGSCAARATVGPREPDKDG
jgi:CPA2 family monovalent cation:H+ antiporter-2